MTLTSERRADLDVHPITSLRDCGVDAFVTDRFGGVSDGPYESLNLGLHVGDEPARVYENRRRVARAIGVGVDRLVIVRQVHGCDVVVAEDATPDTSADAITTIGTDLAVAVLVADCAPIVLCDAHGARLSVVHAGWRGLVAGVIERALAAFDDPSDVRAFIGPRISAAAYQVGPEVAEHFEQVPTALAPDVADRSRLDLGVVARHQLRHLGVRGANIVTSIDVTDGAGRFFSDRSVRPCGRFAVVARRTP